MPSNKNKSFHDKISIRNGKMPGGAFENQQARQRRILKPNPNCKRVEKTMEYFSTTQDTNNLLKICS
jgi:hypothetical protein